MPDSSIAVFRKRPLSVWGLCILDGLLAAFLIASSILAEDFGFSGGQAAIAGISGILISLAAHATWYGNRWGRLVLVIVLTLFLGLLVAQSAMVIAWSLDTGYSGPMVNGAWYYVVLLPLWLCAHYLLLFGKRAKAFFG